MKSKAPILLAAPGAGLGHLTRACAVALALKKIGIEARVVTRSIHAHGLAGLTGCTVDFIAAAFWRPSIPAYVATVNPKLVVLDTFPWGIRAEWRSLGGLRYALLARRLDVEAYLRATGLEWDPSGPQLERVIRIESLSADQTARLEATGGTCHDLEGRIRFPAHDIPTDPPDELAGLLDQQPVVLVVHSGPEDEVMRLVDLAREECRRTGEGQVAIVSTRQIPPLPCPVFRFFPAARLYDRAFRIVTGAGYNSVSERALHPDSHLCLPFARRYDDQAGRLAEPEAGQAEGSAQTARILADWLDS